MIKNIRFELCTGNGKKAYENDGDECEKYHDISLLLC
jgi:hypothetical protein